MDLEKELRLAMAVHVKDASVPRTLASDVRRRHRRRKIRIRVGYAVAFAAGAAALALVPAYQSVRATPAARTPQAVPITSSGVPGRPHRTPGGDAPVVPPSGEAGGKPSSSAGSTPRTLPSEGGGTPQSTPSRGRSVTYLPAGLRAELPCAETTAASRRTTTCRWTGEDGWVEVIVVADDSVRKAADLGALPLLSRDATVHGRPALVSDRLDLGRRIQWAERPGTGVIVSVAYRFRDQLPRIAGGVRP